MTHVPVYLPQDCFNSRRGNDFNVPLSHSSEINPEHAYTGIIYSHWSEKGNSICANMRKSQDEESVYSCIADWKN